MSVFEQRVLNKYADEILAERGSEIDFLEFKALMDAKHEQLLNAA